MTVKSGGSSSDADCHFLASGVAAIINFPLWKASSIAQSGFKIEASNSLMRYYKAVIHPPFRGVIATIGGMTWARGAIFFGSDYGKKHLRELGFNEVLSQTLPPLVIGTIVQCMNMPLVRATITIQDPLCEQKNVTQSIIHIWKTKGFFALWHGVSAGILKTVPKYVTAVVVKDLMEEKLPKVTDPDDKNGHMVRSAVKSMAAGIAGAVLTNPLDVLRNEMFKTDLSISKTFAKLMKEEGWKFTIRGVTSNTTAVTIPVALTIFLTDVLITVKYNGFSHLKW